MPTDQDTDTDEGTDAETSEETPDTDTDTHNPPQPVDPATHGDSDGEEDASTDSDDSDSPDSDGTEDSGETSTATAGTNTNTDNADQQDSDQDNTNTAPAPPVDPNAETEGDSGIDQDGGGTAPDNRGTDPDEGENSIAGPGPANSPGSVIINGTETEDQVLTATLNDADGLPDGVNIRYQWQRNTGADSAFENIDNATSKTYTLGDEDVGSEVRVQVSYTDGNSTDETLTSEATAAVTNINDDPTGSVSIEGTAEEDQILTANVDNVADEDGLGAFSYQWQSNTGANGGFENIENATSETYTLGDADVNREVRVQVSYTDGNNTAETVTSAPTTAVTNVNDEPTGSVAIDGTANEDETLTAETTALQDADGLPADAAGYRHQWQSNTGANRAFENIDNATGETYTLGDADVGRNIRVVVSYTDGGGRTESVTSAATTLVTNVNDEPTGSVTIDGRVEEDQTLTANVDNVTDADGLGAFSYQWQRSNGSGGFENIENATGQTYTLGDGDIGREVRVQISYTDGNNTDESLNSMPTAEVGTANIAPTGAVRIDGTVRQGQQLSADRTALRDADGLPDGAEGYRYQWQRTEADGTFADIEDATEQTYTVAMADVGQRLQVVVSYTDNNGADETLTAATVSAAASNATDPVIEAANIVNGTEGNDQIFKGSGSQRLNGLGDNDFLGGGAGADILDGGDDKDIASYLSDSADIEINLETGTGKGGNAEGDVLINIEGILGGNGNDRLTGNNKDNILNGFWGNDRLDGGEGDDDLDGSVGNDTLNGGSGNDRLIGRDADDILTGGSGNDLFRFEPFDGSDTITDFGTGDDRLQFEFGLFADLEAVRAAATQTDDGNLEIALPKNGTLILEGVTLAALTAETVTTLDAEGNDTTLPADANSASDAPAFELNDLAMDEEAMMRLAASEGTTLPPPEPQAPQAASEKLSPADQALALADPLGPPPLALFDADLEGYAGL